MLEQVLPNVITIIIALIAAFIALYQVKSNIISSSRVSWIENLRDSISSYCVEVSNLATIIKNFHDKAKKLKTSEEVNVAVKEFYPIYHESTNKVTKLRYKVMLCLNSVENEHQEIEKIIDGIENQTMKNKMQDLDRDVIEKDLEKIILLSKIIFKKEWEKSKRIFKI